MTTVIIEKDFVEVKGHSGYDKIGKDIVCAAISTLIEATYNYLIAVNNDIGIKYDDGYCKLNFFKLDNNGKSIIDKFEYMVRDISNQYPKNVLVERKENI